MSESSRGFEYAIDRYVASLEQFVQRKELPTEWFNRPDHLAVKCMDAMHYDSMVSTWGRRSNFASYARMNGRRLASIHLGEVVSLGLFGDVEWLEIMEPRPERVGTDTVGIDHAEFIFADFYAANLVLEKHRIPHELQSNANHAWVNIPINEMGQELKLSDRPLADIITHEVRKGTAQVL